MMRKKTKKIIANIQLGKCKDCEYSYDFFNKNHAGEYIMGKCKYNTHSILLSGSCKNFKLKSN